MNILKKLQSKKGVSIVEMIIAIVIFTLIVVAAFTMYQPITEIARAVRSDNDMQRILTASENYIARQLRNAVEIEIYRVADWTTVRSNANTFAAGRSDPSDDPRMLIIRTNATGNVDIFDVRLNNWGTLVNATALNNSNIGAHRVFNNAFYANINLDFLIALNEDDKTAQVRDKTFLHLTTEATREADAFTRGGALTAGASNVSESQILLSWVGYVESSGGGAHNPADNLNEARFFPPLTPDPNDDWVILYHNNIDMDRVAPVPFTEAQCTSACVGMPCTAHTSCPGTLPCWQPGCRDTCLPKHLPTCGGTCPETALGKGCDVWGCGMMWPTTPRCTSAECCDCKECDKCGNRCVVPGCNGQIGVPSGHVCCSGGCGELSGPACRCVCSPVSGCIVDWTAAIPIAPFPTCRTPGDMQGQCTRGGHVGDRTVVSDTPVLPILGHDYTGSVWSSYDNADNHRRACVRNGTTYTHTPSGVSWSVTCTPSVPEHYEFQAHAWGPWKIDTPVVEKQTRTCTVASCSQNEVDDMAPPTPCAPATLTTVLPVELIGRSGNGGDFFRGGRTDINGNGTFVVTANTPTNNRGHYSDLMIRSANAGHTDNMNGTAVAPEPYRSATATITRVIARTATGDVDLTRTPHVSGPLVATWDHDGGLQQNRVNLTLWRGWHNQSGFPVASPARGGENNTPHGIGNRHNLNISANHAHHRGDANHWGCNFGLNANGDRAITSFEVTFTVTGVIGAGDGHTWGGWEPTGTATCQQPGTEQRRCSVCRTVENRNTGNGAHTWTNWAAHTGATCTVAARERRTCNTGGCSASETRDTPGSNPLEHQGNWVAQVAPTCIADGTDTRTCNRVVGGSTCGAVETRANTTRPGHNWATTGNWVRIDNTNHGRPCTVCSTITGTPTVQGHIDPPNGTANWTNFSATICRAVCNAPGCIHVIERAHDMTAPGTGNCRRCNRSAGCGSGHTWGTPTAIGPTLPTGAPRGGRMLRTCTICGATEEDWVVSVVLTPRNNGGGNELWFQVEMTNNSPWDIQGHAIFFNVNGQNIGINDRAGSGQGMVGTGTGANYNHGAAAGNQAGNNGGNFGGAQGTPQHTPNFIRTDGSGTTVRIQPGQTRSAMARFYAPGQSNRNLLTTENITFAGISLYNTTHPWGA